MSSMIIETSWLALASCSDISLRTFAGAVPSLVAATPKAAPTWSLIRPPILDWSREAALSRFESVLPSRLASTRLSSSAIFSNSASRSCCLLDRLVDLLVRRGLRAAWPHRLAGQRRLTGKVSRGVLLLLLAAGLAVGLVIGRLLRRLPVGDRRNRRRRLGLLVRPGFDGARRPPEPESGRPLIGSGSWAAPSPRSGDWAACFEQVGDRRHPVAGDVLQDLEHLGPFFQVAMPNSGLRIACLIRSSPVTDQAESRRPLARSAAAWFSILRRDSRAGRAPRRPVPAVACWSRTTAFPCRAPRATGDATCSIAR